MFIHSVPPREELTTSPCTTYYALPSFWEHLYSCIFIPNSGFHKNVDIFLSTLHIFINFLFAFKCPVPYVNVTHRYEVGKNTYFSATPCISYRKYTSTVASHTLFQSIHLSFVTSLREFETSRTLLVYCFLSLFFILEDHRILLFNFYCCTNRFSFFFARTSHKISELSSLSRIFCSKSLSCLSPL
jgi:hypothetical protein